MGDTWKEPVLYLVNAVPGQYTFQLRVWDDQGKSGRDAVTVTVKKNPEERNVIRAVFNQVRLLIVTQLIANIHLIGNMDPPLFPD